MTRLTAAAVLWEFCQDAAAPFNVNPLIHPGDSIFAYCVNALPTPQEGVDYYFVDGNASAHKFADLLYRELGYSALESHPLLNVLEFASGYGCVTRHLNTHLRQASVTSCDIHPAAVDFIRNILGVHSIVSKAVPEELSFDTLFDVIFALSFFSHMPESTWGRWLRSLYRALKPGGHLVFTTHGRRSVELIPSKANCSFPESGFFFIPSSEQGDLDVASYGTTYTTPEFVRNEIERCPGAQLVFSSEGYWWSHQDVFIVKNGN